MSRSKRKDPTVCLRVRGVGVERQWREQAKRAGRSSNLQGWSKSGGCSVKGKISPASADQDVGRLVFQIRGIVAKAAQPGEPPSRLSRSSAPRLMKAVTEIALSFQSHLPNPTHVPSD